MDKLKKTEGWGTVRGSLNSHYFRESRSLCGRWGVFGYPMWDAYQLLGTKPNGKRSGTCLACWTKRAREEAKKKGGKHG